MENEHTLEALASHLEHNASVKNVYGEPVNADGRTVIPVAKVAFGLGGGYGNTKENKGETDGQAKGTGAGAGGGMYAIPKGVYEISSQGTRFIPADNFRQFLLGLAAGLLIRSLFGRRRR